MSFFYYEYANILSAKKLCEWNANNSNNSYDFRGGPIPILNLTTFNILFSDLDFSKIYQIVGLIV